MQVNNIPVGFSIKTLDISHLTLIHHFLNTHYTRNDNEFFPSRIVFSEKYLYWYLKKIPKGLMVGLFYYEKLVGTIVADVITVWQANDENFSKGFIIDLLCLNTKLREMKLSKLLISEIKKRISEIGPRWDSGGVNLSNPDVNLEWDSGGVSSPNPDVNLEWDSGGVSSPNPDVNISFIILSLSEDM